MKRGRVRSGHRGVERRWSRPRAMAWAGTLLAGAAAAVALNAGAESTAAVPIVARPSSSAADFRMPAVGAGQPVALSQARGRPVLLSFFASWCQDCRQELATMAVLARSAGSRVQVIGIDVNDESGPALHLLAQDDISYPVGADGGASVATSYGLVGLPTTVYLDASHHVVGRTVGVLTPASGRAWLSAIQRPAA